MPENWIKISEYARRHGITKQAVRDKITRSVLPNKKVNGVFYVIDEDETVQIPQTDQAEQTQAKYTQAVTAKTEIENQLKLERLRNLQQDTIIKKLKQEAIKEKYRLEYAEGVLQCFTEAFSPVKALLTSCKLTGEQTKQFERNFKKSLKAFEEKLTNYLKEKDLQ